ncbi:hypothetical protein ACHAC9_15345 [Massilia sp. CMS3.1]|uniref:hypothetical protein n=1 Tax=Massilia sp. CMS3.1 TaxID=3373083 RepID=UPI003EE7CC19
MVGNKQFDIGANNNGTHNPGTRGPDSLSGRSDPADPDTGQRQGDAGHYTGAPGKDSERAGGIVSAPPESNVGPAGAPQSSRGSASTDVSRETSAAAGGGKPGTPAAGNEDDQGKSVDASMTGTGVDALAEQSPDKPGGADAR